MKNHIWYRKTVSRLFENVNKKGLKKNEVVKNILFSPLSLHKEEEVFVSEEKIAVWLSQESCFTCSIE